MQCCSDAIHLPFRGLIKRNRSVNIKSWKTILLKQFPAPLQKHIKIKCDSYAGLSCSVAQSILHIWPCISCAADSHVALLERLKTFLNDVAIMTYWEALHPQQQLLQYWQLFSCDGIFTVITHPASGWKDGRIVSQLGSTHANTHTPQSNTKLWFGEDGGKLGQQPHSCNAILGLKSEGASFGDFWRDLDALKCE